MAAIEEFFRYGKWPRFYSSSYVVLIPKMDSPTGFDKFRPISLCSVFYKICSKVIVNQLASLLPKMISLEQGAFIPSRSIFENISLTQEMTHSINNKIHGGNVILKVDMAKAYDHIDCDFILKVLRAFGFSNIVCDLIAKCISTPWYSILMNGTTKGFFRKVDEDCGKGILCHRICSLFYKKFYHDLLSKALRIRVLASFHKLEGLV